MAYKTNYELWNPALTSRRPSQMSDIDIILSQTYPHVATLPYMQCQHCNPYNYEDEIPGSPSTFTTFFSSSTSGESSEEAFEYLSAAATNAQCIDDNSSSSKCRKIRQRLRQLLKRSSRPNN